MRAPVEACHPFFSLKGFLVQRNTPFIVCMCISVVTHAHTHIYIPCNIYYIYVIICILYIRILQITFSQSLACLFAFHIC